MTSILYNDLKTLIIDNQLVPEEQYRITDYVTTVAKTNYTSAGYKFDIVVTALTNNTLYEYATLMANATETYFDVDALLLYNVKYNVNNIIPDYSNDWVDSTGKGCIYYMADNLGNEALFDFKNIKYNGKFLFNNTLDGTDTSQTVSEYNSVKEVIEGGVFIIPLVSFNDECHNVSIGINASEVTITESSNLQIGDNCENSDITNVNNTTIGNELSDITLTSIDGAEIGDNCVALEITNQTNLILGNNNNTITLGGGNGIIIDSNNTNVIIGTNANDIYINASKAINLGNNTEQFNISSSYDLNTASDCKLFTLNETNHLTATTGCESINAISNDYIALTEAVKNITISEGLNNLILDGTKLTGIDAKVIIQQDEKVVVINEQTNSEVVLAEDGTTTSNPTSFINDSPSDGFIYGRKDGNWEQIDTSGGGGVSIIPITWSDLKSLCDAGTLVPGQLYRITDYVCTTTTANSRAVNNLFDIVVTALDASHLSENASATYHAGDTYFSSNNAKLESWKLKYCIDNDTARFDWADTTNGKGVIYYMKDNRNNEVPYDFKNIQYNKGGVWVYTFGGATDNSVVAYYDAAEYKYQNCVDNIIGVYRETVNQQNIKYKLSFNKCGYGFASNKLGINCVNNTFGNDCYYNKFGNYCRNNTFGNICVYNTFGNECSSNNFGWNNGYNTFGDNCSSNAFDSDCFYNTLGDNCHSNSLGQDCYSITFGNECLSNTFNKYNIKYIVLEEGCTRNTFNSALTTSQTTVLQRIRIRGLQNTSITTINITLNATNTKYEWVVCYTSGGTLKQYCPDD